MMHPERLIGGISYASEVPFEMVTTLADRFIVTDRCNPSEVLTESETLGGACEESTFRFRKELTKIFSFSHTGRKMLHLPLINRHRKGYPRHLGWTLPSVDCRASGTN